ncbi:MAG: UDP-3-O-(3-hydroxymyristoyl)glucosamine N-acyltransferase [Bacteroidota bacterium]|nr:UDP-3-O-(3-hydroxymyristoyl)glucosamine N-acyltransferase [Bacteroidota bacterium]
MKFLEPISVSRISSLLDIPFFGDGEKLVYGLNEINRCEEGDIIFVNHPKYQARAELSKATAIITKIRNLESKKIQLISNRPFLDFNLLIKKVKPSSTIKLKCGENTFIHPSVVIGNNVKIGSNCKIHPNVVFYDNVNVGDNCVIHSNSVIGSNAFYFNKENNQYTALTTCGSVRIGNHVEIGANNTIDSGVTNETVIGDGTKIDNLVHIGHDTKIGKNCLIAAQVGIAGCNTIGDNVTLWGQVGIPSNLKIGKGATILGKSGPISDVKENDIIFGVPGINSKQRFRELIIQRKLPDILKKLNLE